MIVAKFGGGVLDGADGIRRVRSEILRLPSPLLVVVSAFADITNRLERVAHAALGDLHSAQKELAAVVAHHNAIAHDVLSEESFVFWSDAIAPYLQRLDEVVEGISIVHELSPRTLDLVVHFGELFSSLLVFFALFDSEDLDRSIYRIPALEFIITDNSHRYARPDLELTVERVEKHLRPELQTVGIVVTEGYIARSQSGQVTTMGRESSDYTATMLGELLGADEVRLYTRVPGILSADPAIVADPRPIPTMSYGMAHSLSELGAKILHPRTVTPVERAGIPLVITSLGAAATTINADGGDPEGVSVALLPDAELLLLETTTAGSSVEEFLRTVAREVPIIWHQRFRRRLEVVLSGPWPHDELPTQTINEPVTSQRHRVGVVSMVREGTIDRGGLEFFMQHLPTESLRGIHWGIDPRAASALVERDAATDAVRRLHTAILGKEDGGGG
jgi:aspartate kinase